MIDQPVNKGLDFGSCEEDFSATKHSNIASQKKTNKKQCVYIYILVRLIYGEERDVTNLVSCCFPIFLVLAIVDQSTDYPFAASRGRTLAEDSTPKFKSYASFRF